MTGSAKKQPIPFGKYLLLDRINIGGMAEVWRGKAFAPGGFERLVAIKRILPNIAEDDEFLAMFIDEAKISVQLSHPNIGQIYDLGQINGSYFIAMEYVPGKDLRAVFDRCRRKKEPAPIALTCHVMRKVCEGLDHAHRKLDAGGKPMHIVHRDVSPQNVLISFDGDVKVIDFGIAKAAGKATKTQAGILKGKFGYMSPEQVRGFEIDHRADIFAIGICLYELLTGERLFVGETDFAVLEKVRDALVPSPSTINPAIPPELEAIVFKALSKDLDHRYQHASEMAAELERFMRTAGLNSGKQELGAFMHGFFADEVEREAERLAEYREIHPPPGFVIEEPKPRRTTSTTLPAPPPPAATAAPAEEDEESGATLLIGPNVVAEALQPLVPPSDEEEITSATNPVLSSPGVVAEPPKLAPGIPVLAPVGGDDEDAHTTLQRRPRPSGPRAPPPASSGAPAPEPATLRNLADVPDGTGSSLSGSDLTGPVTAGSTPAFGTNHTSVTDPQLRPLAPLSVPVLDVGPHNKDVIPSLAQTLPARPAWNKPQVPIAPLKVKRAGERPSPMGALRASGAARLRRIPLPALGAVALLCVVAVVWAVHEPATGYLLIDVPAEIRPAAHLNVNGKSVPGPITWPVLERLPTGRAMVMVSADGYKPFVRPVEVQAGDRPTSVLAALARLDDRIRMVVETDPATAEVKLDGRVGKALGSPGYFVADVRLGQPAQLQVSAPGYASKTVTVTPDTPGETLTEKIALEPAKIALEVSSMPAGAEVTIGGKSLGTTPAKLHVLADTHAVVIQKRCYLPATLEITPPAAPGAAVTLHANLERQPGCR